MTGPDQQSHSVGHAECNECWTTWLAVWPLGARNLRCPNCDSTHTTRTSIEEEEE